MQQRFHPLFVFYWCFIDFSSSPSCFYSFKYSMVSKCNIMLYTRRFHWDSFKQIVRNITFTNSTLSRGQIVMCSQKVIHYRSLLSTGFCVNFIYVRIFCEVFLNHLVRLCTAAQTPVKLAMLGWPTLIPVTSFLPCHCGFAFRTSDMRALWTECRSLLDWWVGFLYKLVVWKHVSLCYSKLVML